MIASLAELRRRPPPARAPARDPTTSRRTRRLPDLPGAWSVLTSAWALGGRRRGGDERFVSPFVQRGTACHRRKDTSRRS